MIASGGIGTIQDILNLLPFEKEGIIGAIAGRALYEGKLDFKAAMKAAKAAPVRTRKAYRPPRVAVNASAGSREVSRPDTWRMSGDARLFDRHRRQRPSSAAQREEGQGEGRSMAQTTCKRARRAIWRSR